MLIFRRSLTPALQKGPTTSRSSTNIGFQRSPASRYKESWLLLIAETRWPSRTSAHSEKLLSASKRASSAGLNPRWWENESWIGHRLTPTMKSSLSLHLPAWPDIHRNYAEQVVAQLHTAGVPLLAGTDSPAPGLAHGPSLHRELELLVDSGLSPSEALTAATFTPATVFGFHDRGRVAVGLRADLLLVRGDPTTDIRAVHNIVGVWKLGTRYYPEGPEGSRGH